MNSSNYKITYRSSIDLLQLLRLNQCASLFLSTLIVVLPLNILLHADSAVAQESSIQSLSLNKNTIYVNPKNGDDSQLGKKSSPLKTITQALEVASAGTIIQLAPGTYSEDTGETFPLIVKDRIVLKGDPQNQGYKTIIKGDGYFISPTGAGQHIAIAAIKDAGGITGVTVTNNHSRGHGIWVESANPQIISNTFTRNGNTGVSLNGKSSPKIENNYFYNNSGNGLLIYGTSQPEVIDNTFEQTGFGISLVQQTAATISDNLFDGNRIGIILEGDSQATLRNNEIINSDESGLTAIAQSRVDLGTDNEPGNNIFRSNKKLDIQNATNNQIVAVGTEVQAETTGDINFSRGTFVASEDRTFKDLPPLPNRNNLEEQPLSQTVPTSEVTETPSNLPAPPPVLANNTGNKELVFTGSSSSSPAISDIEPIPFLPQVGNTASSSTIQVKYKVLVETLSQSEENEVRSLYPEAFKTIFQGQPWLQVGAFNNRDKARQTEENLANLGLATYLLE